MARQKKQMTKKAKSGTLSTIGNADKVEDALAKMRTLLGLGKLRIGPHANQRMGQRNIIYYEIQQALFNGKWIKKKDRFSTEFNSWNYCIEGKTNDLRKLRIIIGFVQTDRGENILVITAVDIGK